MLAALLLLATVSDVAGPQLRALVFGTRAFGEVEEANAGAFPTEIVVRFGGDIVGACTAKLDGMAATCSVGKWFRGAGLYSVTATVIDQLPLVSHEVTLDLPDDTLDVDLDFKIVRRKEAPGDAMRPIRITVVRPSRLDVVLTREADACPAGAKRQECQPAPVFTMTNRSERTLFPEHVFGGRLQRRVGDGWEPVPGAGRCGNERSAPLVSGASTKSWEGVFSSRSKPFPEGRYRYSVLYALEPVFFPLLGKEPARVTMYEVSMEYEIGDSRGQTR